MASGGPLAMDSVGLQPPDDPGILRFDQFTLDLRQRALYRDGTRLKLTAKPLDTLVALVSRPGQTIGKQELMDAVWKDTAVTEDVLVQAIGEIRRVLGEKKGEDRFVQTIPRQGYRFVMPVAIVRPGTGQAGDASTATPDAGPDRAAKPAWIALAVLAAAASVALVAAIVVPRWASPPAPAPSPLAPAAPSATAVRLARLTVFGTIHAGGIVAEIDGDANRNSVAALEWRAEGGTFRSAHPLVRIDDAHFAGSLFWLSPASSYDVRVVLTDPDGVDGATSATATLRTEPDAWPEATLGGLHVSPSGRDANSGASAAEALRTIQRAADLARPGDVVLIHPGIYRETIRVRKSGTAIQPVVFRGAAPGAVIDGADERIALGVRWTAAGDGVHFFDAGFATTHVTTDAGRLFKYARLGDLRALRAGAPGGFFADGARIYLKFADGSAPEAHTIQAGRLDRGFVLEKLAWIGIENLELRHFGGAETGVGVLLRDCTSCRVTRCRIGEVRRAGVWIEGGERGRIEENEIWDTSIAGWPWHSISLSTADNHGIFFAGASPRGFIIRRNRIRGTFDAIAPCGTAPPSDGVSTETDVYDNELTGLGDDGIEAEPYCANLRLWGNRVVGSMMAISTAPAGPGPVWIVRNIAHRFGATRGREVWLASALKINTFDKAATGPVFLYHNTFVADIPEVDAVALLAPGAVAFVRARNNVLAGTRHALLKVNPLHWDGDGNDLHTTSGGALVDWLGARYPRIEAFRAATGQERAGFSAPPLFIDPAGGNFTPRSGSPLIDRGLLIAGINDRFSGRGPDVGAIEAGR